VRFIDDYLRLLSGRSLRAAALLFMDGFVNSAAIISFSWCIGSGAVVGAGFTVRTIIRVWRCYNLDVGIVTAYIEVRLAIVAGGHTS
jgi:hypothetical protein